MPRMYDPFAEGGPSFIEETDRFADDLDEILHGQRKVAPDGSMASEISHMAQQRDSAHAGQNKDNLVQNVNINPFSARKGILGGSAKVANGAPPQRVVNWNADRQDEAIPMTITLAAIDSAPNGAFSTGGIPVIDAGNVINAPSPSPGAQNRGYANVYWVGGRGGPQVAQVDVGKGCQFTISGSMVAVDVGLDAGDTAGAMNIGAWLSFYSAARPSPVTRTRYVDALGGPVVGFAIKGFSVPPFARRLLPLYSWFKGATQDATAPIGVQYQIDFVDINGTVICGLYGGGGNAPFSTSPFPIPNDAYAFSVTNKDTNVPSVRALTTRLVFELGL